MNVMLSVLIFLSVSLNALAQIVLRKAMLTVGPLPSLTAKPAAVLLALGSSVYIWIGIVCYIASLALWLAVLARAQVSYAYPMLSIGYVIAAVLGVAFLGENMGLERAGAILIICLGVFLVSRTA